jgi:hypothetical protein
MRVRQNGKLFSSALVAALLLVTAGTLAAQDVRYNFMPRTDFSKYRTYTWVNIRGAHPDQIMDAEIKQSVDSQLASKGITKKPIATRLIFISATRPSSIKKHNGMPLVHEPSGWARDRGLVRRSVSAL